MLDNFKEIELHWDKVNQDFYQEINGVAGDTNGRRLKLYITDNGEAIDLTENKVKFYWRYKFSNYNSITEFIATDITKGAFYFYIPTEMQSAGEIVGNIAIENAKDVSILISKEITIKISESQFGTSLEETKNKADAITTMILDAVPKDITESLSKKVDKTAIIDIAHGGTGNTSGRSTGLTYRQLTESTNLNTITDYACGTMYYLNNKVDSSQLPTGFSTYSQMITNNGTQLLINTTDGRLATRAIQNSVWSEWRVQLDWKNPTQVVGTDTTSTGTAYSITNTNLPKTLVNGYSFSFIPNISSTSQSATLSINGGTAYPFYKFDTYTGSIYQVASSNATSNFLQANVIYKTTYKNGVWIINDLPIPNVSGVNGTLAIGNGGTGNIYGTASSTSITTGIASLLTFKLSAVGNTSRINLRTASSASGTPTTNTFDGTFACFPATTAQDGKFLVVDRTTGIWYAGTGQYTYLDGTWTNTTGNIYWTQIFDSGTTIPIKNGGTGNVISSSQSSSGIGVTINGLLKGGTIVGTQKLEGNYLKIFGNISNTTDGIPVSGTTFHCILTTNGTSTVSILAFDEWSGKAFSSNISGTYSDKTFTCGADVVWTDLSQQPVGGVVMNTSSTASGFTGTWSNIGNATIGSTVVYYWKKTA